MLKRLDIDLSGDRQLLHALDAAPARLRQQLEKAVDRGGAEAARAQRRAAPKAHSTLVISIRSVRERELSVLVGPSTDYAAFVNSGSRPGGKPALQVMIDWLRVKGISPRNPQHSIEDLAFLIRRSIARKGIKPQPFIDNAATAIEPRIHSLLQAAVRRSLAEVGL